MTSFFTVFTFSFADAGDSDVACSPFFGDCTVLSWLFTKEAIKMTIMMIFRDIAGFNLIEWYLIRVLV